jgi:hypothetical protein
VEKIAIPNFFNTHVSASLLSELVVIGSRMQAGLPVDSERLDALVRGVYGAESLI